MAIIRIRGIPVEFVEQGSGEPVLLLHSSASSGAQWRALVELLSGRYRVIAPDLYGYGATPLLPGRAPFGLADEAEIVCALLGEFGEPAHLVGHSYGGAVALHVARLHGHLLRSLAVIEPVAFHLLRQGGPLDALALAEIRAVADGVARALACGDYLEGFGRFVDYWSGPGSWSGVPGAKRDAMAARLAKVALDFHATLNEPARVDDFRWIALPALVLQGACSPLPTRRICERLAAVLPEARMKTIEGAGHMCPVTHRDEINALIAAHLDSNAGPLFRRMSFHQLQGGNHASHAAQ